MGACILDRVALLILFLSLLTDSDDQHEHDTRQPVYETPPLKYTAERILQILLDPEMP